MDLAVTGGDTGAEPGVSPPGIGVGIINDFSGVSKVTSGATHRLGGLPLNGLTADLSCRFVIGGELGVVFLFWALLVEWVQGTVAHWVLLAWFL